MKRERDQQRKRVYDWERTLETLQPSIKEPIEVPAIIKLLDRIGKHYNVRTPKIADGRGTRNASWRTGAYCINLPRWARRTDVVLHEAAHWIHDRVFGAREGAHGRVFVAVYLYLLNKYAGLPLDALAKSANDAGVDFASATAFKPPSEGNHD